MHLPPLALPVVAALMLHAGAHAAADEDRLRADLAALLQRVERLEQDNRELRGKLERAGATEQRVQTLEQDRGAAERALATDRLSEREPEIVTRLKAVEFQTLEMQKQARQLEALEGISVSASLTGMAQSVNAAGAADPAARSRGNYRGDIAIALPGGTMGDIEGKLFGQLRFGQGTGLSLRPTYTSSVNTAAFETGIGPDDSFAILAQAWYQLNIPLPRGGYKPHSREQIVVNVGKMDPFLFFDQNAIADDETVRFANNVFVHNPLLDSGRDIGADRYGFTPGVRVAYESRPTRSERWAASLGVFASGDGANFSGSLGKPLVVAQLETTRRLFGGLAGTWRAYAWRNARASDADGATAAHAGLGASADQRLDDDWTVFARYGHQLAGRPRFDRALTLGAETDGSRWGRGADGVGLAVGWLRSDAAYRASGAASANEGVVELYYRYLLNSRVQITPDVQWILRPAGQAGASAVRAIGLRARVGF